MNYPYSTFLSGSPAAPPDLAVLATVLVTLVIAAAVLFKNINYCLDDLNRRAIVTGGDKRFWAVVIILGGPVGQIVYWLYGRGPY
jgi:hypothetical protein